MSQKLLFVLFVFCAVLFIVVVGSESRLAAQTSNEPEYPICAAGFNEDLRFGPGILQRPDAISATFTFTVPTGSGSAGTVLVWQGEGHHWDHSCNIGPNNDGGRFPCDQVQTQEIITFTANGEAIGQFIDHSSTNGDDAIYFYEFPFGNLVDGENELRLNHLNQGSGANSVHYKGVVCTTTIGREPPTGTPTPTSTSTSTATPTDTSTPLTTSTNTPTPTDTSTPETTSTNTPTATATDTSTATPTSTSTTTATATFTPTPTATDESETTALDPVDQPPRAEPGQFCSNGTCQFLPLISDR
jgi:hypothetical protein